jgi:predicted RNA-binding Zn ribbon-like protein
VDLLTDPAIGRLKECESDDCVILFLPAHPRRRWCSPTRCGNRARVARYYHRHKPTATGKG